MINENNHWEEVVETAQIIIDSLFAVVLLLVGWILNNVSQAVKSLRDKDDAIAKDITSVKVDIAAEKANREGIEKFLNRMDEKLDAIFEKLEKKADK